MWPVQQLQIYCETNQRNQYEDWFNGYCTIDFYSFLDLGTSKKKGNGEAVLIDFSTNRSWLAMMKGVLAAQWSQHRNILLILDPMELEELILGNDLGVYDFVLKPFGKIELLYRTYRMLHQNGTTFSYPKLKTNKKFNLYLNTIKREASRDTLPAICLTPVEFSILQCLSQSDGYSIQRREIVSQIWGNVRISSKTLDVHVSNLRKKIQTLNLNVNWVETDSYVLEDFRKDELPSNKSGVQ